ncbi:hypothetical protein, partial [Aeromonas caviae]
MHFARILMATFSPTGVQPGFKVFSLVEFFQSPCTDFGFALTQKVMLVTFVPVTKEIANSTSKCDTRLCRLTVLFEYLDRL